MKTREVFAVRALNRKPAGTGAVLTAYGFSAKKDLPAQLLTLNQEDAANWHEC
jgi:hypothetical protein